MATWPASLPDNFLVDSYTESLPDNTLRTPMDVGPAKMRKRSTAWPVPVSGTQYMTPDQLATFTVFYQDTLGDGSLRFDWTHPRLGTNVEFRFVTAPAYKRNKSKGETIGWLVSFDLEIMP